MIRYALALLIALLSLSCENESPLRIDGRTIFENSGSQEQLLRATTTKTSYTLREQIRITIYNGSDSIIYLPTCARQISYYLQKNVGGTWEDTGANGIPCIGYNAMGKITLLPGRSYVYNDAIVHFGAYRFRYPVTMGRSTNTVWLFTNEFSVDGN